MLLDFRTTRGINILNIGLILISCVIAFIIPFELFLFSYAVLGPLHYLTEISWLHKQNYYTKGKYDFVFLIILCIISTVGNLFLEDWQEWGIHAVFIGFVASLIFVFLKDNYLKVLALFVLAFSAVIFEGNNFYYLFFAVFLPTLIHVFVFTFLFMWYGAIKSKSSSGYLSVIILMICAASFFFISPGFGSKQLSEYVIKSYSDSFASVNYYLIDILKPGTFSGYDTDALNYIFTSDTGYRVMRFIAFAYTYHYLNWFSKTSVIKWHQVPKTRLILVGVLWIASLLLYAISYKLGLHALYFLSLLHVYLEFPLNFVSFAGVGKQLSSALSISKTA